MSCFISNVSKFFFVSTLFLVLCPLNAMKRKREEGTPCSMDMDSSSEGSSGFPVKKIRAESLYGQETVVDQQCLFDLKRLSTKNKTARQEIIGSYSRVLNALYSKDVERLSRHLPSAPKNLKRLVLKKVQDNRHYDRSFKEVIIHILDINILEKEM